MSNHDARFAAALQDLDEERLREFVAALWRRRGRSVEDPGSGPLRVGGEDGYRLFVHAGADPPVESLADGDRLVVPGLTVASLTDRDSGEAESDASAGDDGDEPEGPSFLVAIPDAVAGATVIDAAGLRQRALYAVDETGQAELADRFFDGDVDCFGGYDGDFDDGDDADPTGPAVERSALAGPDPDSRSPGDGDRPGSRPATSGDGPGPPGATDGQTTGATGRGSPGDPDDSPGDPAEEGPYASVGTFPGAAVDRRSAGDPDGDDGATPDRGPVIAPSRRVILVIAVLFAAVVGVWALGAAGIGPLAGGPSEERPRDVSRAGLPPDYEFNAIGRTTVPDYVDLNTSGPGPGENASLPPGVDADGSIDEARLADAHLAAIENSSYRVSITYRERVEGVYRVRWEERAQVRANGNYTTEVVRIGDPVGSAMLIDAVPSASSDRYRDPPANGPVATADGPAGANPYPDRFENAIDWYLSVDESRIEGRFTAGNTTYFWITYRGDPWPGVEDTTGSALVDERGVVYEIHRQYSLPDRRDVRVSATIRLADLNGTTVPVAGNRTAPVEANVSATGNESGSVDGNESTTGGNVTAPAGDDR